LLDFVAFAVLLLCFWLAFALLAFQLCSVQFCRFSIAVLSSFLSGRQSFPLAAHPKFIALGIAAYFAFVSLSTIFLWLFLGLPFTWLSENLIYFGCVTHNTGENAFAEKRLLCISLAFCAFFWHICAVEIIALMTHTHTLEQQQELLCLSLKIL